MDLAKELNTEFCQRIVPDNCSKVLFQRVLPKNEIKKNSKELFQSIFSNILPKNYKKNCAKDLFQIIVPKYCFKEFFKGIVPENCTDESVWNILMIQREIFCDCKKEF